jgi:hypothetical protein
LDLSKNEINDAGGELIASALADNITLSRLNLKRNNLKFTTGECFVESMKKNVNLSYLNLEDNTINVNVIEEIQEYL